MANKNFSPDVRQSLANLAARRAAIMRNADLTPEGQRRQAEALQAEAARYRSEAHNSLRLTWHFIRRDYADLDRKTAEAQAAAGARWDFTRLNYEAQAAKLALKNVVSNGFAGDFEAARRVFESWASSGDSHRARAMLENGPEIMKARFSSSNTLEVNRLTRDAGARLAALMATPELQALEAEGGELVRRAVEARDVTQEASAFFDPAANSPFSSGNEFTALLAGVSLAQRFTPDSLGYTTSLEITGEQPAPAAT